MIAQIIWLLSWPLLIAISFLSIDSILKRVEDKEGSRPK
jgi:hypothetical protein